MAAFFKLFLEARYTLVNTAFRKHDPNHLLIGDRWTPTTARSDAIVRTAGEVFSTWSRSTITPSASTSAFLDRIHGWASKPILLSEFYYAAADQGLTAATR